MNPATVSPTNPIDDRFSVVVYVEYFCLVYSCNNVEGEKKKTEEVIFDHPKNGPERQQSGTANNCCFESLETINYGSRTMGSSAEASIKLW